MSQKVFSGEGLFKSLDIVLNHRKPRTVLLVSGKRSFLDSGAKEIVTPLLNDLKLIEFSGFSTIPQLDDIYAVHDLCQKQHPDLVIAIGGGTAIDIAKIASATVDCEKSEIEKILKDNLPTTSHVPVLAIPTTAGSGSEATHFAVVYADGRKYSYANKKLLPEYAILAPQLLKSLSPTQLAISGLDALCQGIESFWSVNSNTESKRYSERAVSLAVEHLVSAVEGDKKAQKQMLQAAHQAGRAINITKTTAPHALSYELTAKFGIPHGHAVVLTIGAFFVFNESVSEQTIQDSRGVDFVKKEMNQLYKLLGVDSAGEAENLIKELQFNIGLPNSLLGMGVKKEDVPDIARAINFQRAANNPRKMSQTDAERILNQSL